MPTFVENQEFSSSWVLKYFVQIICQNLEYLQMEI